MGPQEHKVERRLAAIFAADVAGYSRLMEQDEVGTLRALTGHREIMDRLISEHGGKIANTAGDSVLAEFPSAVDAVRCAFQVQQALASLDQDTPKERRLQFRIGIHVGDVMVRGSDLLGDGVNIAARLESLAEPGGICISAGTHSHVRRALPMDLTISDHKRSRISMSLFTSTVFVFQLCFPPHSTSDAESETTAHPGQTLHCRAAVHEHERRSGSSISG